jgi:hypothetical protein
MSWIRAFLELNKSLFLRGLLLLMAFLLGLQMGQSRLQRQWDAEKQTVQIAQAKQEQHDADLARFQNQISKEVSDDYLKKSSMLASRTDVAEWVFDKSESNSSGMPSVSAPAGGVADPLADSVLTPFGNEKGISCKQLIQDATRTTLMLNAIQIWYERQSINLK